MNDSSRHYFSMKHMDYIYIDNNITLNATLGDMNATGIAQIMIPQELFLMLGLISLVENILVVVAIIKNRNLHSPMYYFICCLAMSDMLVSVSNVVETLFMLFTEHGLLLVTAKMLQHLDNVIDIMICSSVVSSLSFLCTIAAGPLYHHLLRASVPLHHDHATCRGHHRSGVAHQHHLELFIYRLSH